MVFGMSPVYDGHTKKAWDGSCKTAPRSQLFFTLLFFWNMKHFAKQKTPEL
jgi:hypothetical protein